MSSLFSEQDKAELKGLGVEVDDTTLAHCGGYCLTFHLPHRRPVSCNIFVFYPDILVLSLKKFAQTAAILTKLLPYYRYKRIREDVVAFEPVGKNKNKYPLLRFAYNCLSYRKDGNNELLNSSTVDPEQLANDFVSAANAVIDTPDPEVVAIDKPDPEVVAKKWTERFPEFPLVFNKSRGIFEYVDDMKNITVGIALTRNGPEIRITHSHPLIPTALGKTAIPLDCLVSLMPFLREFHKFYRGQGAPSLKTMARAVPEVDI